MVQIIGRRPVMSSARPLPRGARIKERFNIKYPSVTTVISGVDPINFPEAQLKQYASRGSIVHAQARHFLSTGKWEVDIFKIPRTEDEMLRMNCDYLIVTRGDLQLRWEDCNFLGFWEKHGKDFKPWPGKSGEESFFNEPFRYTGTPDWPCLYRDEPAIVDFKTSGHYPADRVLKFKKQGAAYTKVERDGVVKTFIIVPLNPKNKCGFGAPIIERDVEKYFNLFVRDRWMFQRIFGL